MKQITLFTLAILFFSSSTFAQKMYNDIELNEAWINEISKLAPNEATATPKEKRKVLLFSHFTGFDHKVIPFTDEVIKMLGEKTSAYSVDYSTDIYSFEKDKLKQYDAVIINNTCPKREYRNLFIDELEKNTSINEKERLEIATKLQTNLTNYIKKGGGFVVLHGALTMFNYSDEFSDIVGASFDYHPPLQELEVHVVNEDEPLTKPFKNGSFTHEDEPYMFNNAYFDYNFHPLLYIEADKIEKKKEGEIENNTLYIAWVKPYNKGKVFYCSPSHNPSSYKNAELLQFMLNGIQYALGDLQVDDSPLK